MFIHYSGKIIDSNLLEKVEYQSLVSKGYIRLVFKHERSEVVTGPDAFNIVMQLCPQALEGENAKYQRHAWAVHNLVGHPMMQLCAFLGLTKLGLKIHDSTVPNPITK